MAGKAHARDYNERKASLGWWRRGDLAAFELSKRLHNSVSGNVTLLCSSSRHGARMVPAPIASTCPARNVCLA
jgi:hypothetical protein